MGETCGSNKVDTIGAMVPEEKPLRGECREQERLLVELDAS